MGGNSSEEQKHHSESDWKQYEGELADDKASSVEPYTLREMGYLEQLFKELDKKGMGALQLKDFEEIGYLKSHPLFPRIRQLFEQEMRKIKAKRINFELFLFLLSVFHVRADLDSKYKFLFRLYDCDRNLKLDANDLNKVYRLIYQQAWMQDDDFSKLVTETLIRYGNKGEIKLEALRQLVPEDEVRELLSFRFNGKFG